MILFHRLLEDDEAEILRSHEVATLRAALNDEVRRLLGQWVSEDTPVLVFDHYGVFVGLAGESQCTGLDCAVAVKASAHFRDHYFWRAGADMRLMPLTEHFRVDGFA